MKIYITNMLYFELFLYFRETNTNNRGLLNLITKT